ncbi:tetratricopeptide repeat-containing sensor histidine kinase [Psychroserpens sp.]|uniref:ATP-binding protein n=1 Tax=Psychroserpens sp. TaxID=2020870 RepID=UPI001B2608A1|nr:tetratricopeptide repeat-containing sensor histidine kinase [Psychroserpens sp.]MBO6606270.1 tetratricopeptide repeat-containing sensor histidine kinase [Psychroserpens sp.]MBO6655124.1 tetratricopeptide repeat-containing sensor histidine kinase [Psychroserpens sp.]MBO6683286.1 tetratricopeptide repeat-containing sensor histidine kinase [Psychroserpens sp.]MBO6751387.1 tetratricopeptide repeat-containing sensor histidine kinase [Psychroserpens sp.]MBO6916775.1 tetratricopeptide repeat-conta
MKQLMTLAVFLTSIICFSQTNEIDSLTIQLAYQKQDSAKVETSLHLVKALYDSKNYKKALLYIDQTERLSKFLNHVKGIADVNYYKALIYAQRDDYYNAIDGYNRSRRYYSQLGDTLGIAKVNNSIGLIEIKRGNYSVGLENSLSAIQTFESRNLRDELSSAYNNLAEAYFNTNQIDKALEFNIKALNVREQLKDSVGIKTSTKNVALLYSERKEHRKAIEYYEKVLRLLNPATDGRLRGEILPRIGAEYLQFKDYVKAAEYLVEGLTYNRRINNEDGILRALNAIGELNIQIKKTKLAELQINEAYNIALKINNRKELLKNYKLHKELDSINGRFQNAFFWQSKYYELKSELDKESQPIVPVITEPIKVEPLDATDNFNAIAKQQQEEENEQLFKRLKAISYVLGAAFLIVSTILLLIYLKRKNTLKFNKKLKEKNEQIEQKNTELAKQAAHLEEVNHVKDRLFSIVSHDLKDSISSIKGFIDLLKENGLSKEEFYDLIPELSENADSASQLLFNLLNWSKSQMQNLEPKADLFNIQDVFRDKMNLVEQKVEQKRIVMIDESQRDFVYADRSMIEIVIQNLITNAVKFTRVGDVITVSNSDLNGKSLICIEDTGVGISRENIDKLFQKSTFTTRGTDNEKGTGLGLTICKELVELNKGRIWVESQLNVGTKFYVELPKSKPA